MDPAMQTTLAALAATSCAIAWSFPKLRRRWQLSRAKHRSLAGHSRMAKRVAGMIPGYSYAEDAFFASDGAPPDIVMRRRSGFERLAAAFAQRYPSGSAMTPSPQSAAPST